MNDKRNKQKRFCSLVPMTTIPKRQTIEKWFTAKRELTELWFFFVFGPADSAKWERALKCAGPTVLRGVWQRPRYLYYILRNFKISRNSCFSEILFLMWSSQLCLAIFVWADLRPSPQFFLSQIGFLTLLLTRNVNDKNFSQIQTYKNKNTVVPISILGRS